MNQCNKCDADNLENAKYCSNCGYELPKKDTVQQEYEPKPPKKKNIKPVLGMLVGAAAFLIAYFFVQQMFFKSQPVDKVMMEVASEINKSTPIMLDACTRFDNSIALPSNIFQYNYTLICLEKDSIEDIVELERTVEQNLTNLIRTDPEMKYFRDNNIIVNYNYRDLNGIHLFKISITPDQYK